MNVDPSVLLFAFAVSILAGVLCSFPAILHLSRRAAYNNLEESLRERSTFTSQHSSGPLSCVAGGVRTSVGFGLC